MLANAVARVEELAKILETLKGQYNNILGRWEEAKSLVITLESGVKSVENAVQSTETAVNNVMGVTPSGETNNEGKECSASF